MRTIDGCNSSIDEYSSLYGERRACGLSQVLFSRDPLYPSYGADEKPAEALACFIEFKKSDEAGADTSYKMGKACETLGDFTRAAACYEEVTAYEQHPLYYEARDALQRVKRGAAAPKPV